ALLRAPQLKTVRERVAAACPALGGTRLQLTCTHTHTAAEASYLFGGSPDDTWLTTLEDKLTEAVLAAERNLAPVTPRLGQIEVPLNHNRRVPGDEGRSRMVLEYQE